ncbi:MAG: hypothetical protein K8R87_07845 [Verrucomicrobia bacterium]|nr:hypothetical protein [Verrucomicrobiota bacterium]
MKTILRIFIFTVLASLASAQTTPPTPAPAPATDSNNPNFWQASFTNGGHYLVKLNHINCASKHQYISDGVARVVEVTIGTDTAVVARFYFFEPAGKDTPLNAGQILLNRAQDTAQQAAARVSPNAARLNVVKNYPASTHAHTVEYSVQDEATINSLYASLLAAISSGRGRTWKEGGGDSAK